MDPFSVIIVAVIILVIFFFCGVWKNYQTKNMSSQSVPVSNNRGVYVTEAAAAPPPYPGTTTYLSMPQPMLHMSGSQSSHSTGLGWQNSSTYSIHTDCPPSYEEVMHRTTTETRQRQQSPAPQPNAREPQYPASLLKQCRSKEISSPTVAEAAKPLAKLHTSSSNLRGHSVQTSYAKITATREITVSQTYKKKFNVTLHTK